jgi:hypothetical protein
MRHQPWSPILVVTLFVSVAIPFTLAGQEQLAKYDPQSFIEGNSLFAESGVSAQKASPVAVLSPTHLSMFCRNVLNAGCQCTTGTAKLTNTGNALLRITSIVTTRNFSERSNCRKTLNAGGSCIITVSFQPPGTGVHSGTLSVSENAVGSPVTASLGGLATCSRSQ